MVAAAPLYSRVVGHGVSNDLDQKDAEGLLASRSFFFAERYKTIDMATVENINLERIQKDVDIGALQQHLEMLTYGDMSKSLVKPLGLTPNDSAFLKLFRLSQLTIEYLLNVQDVLSEGIERTTKKCRDAHKRIDRYKLKAKEYDARIQGLKAELKTKRGAVNTYEALVSKTNGKTHSSSRRSRNEYKPSRRKSSSHRVTATKPPPSLSPAKSISQASSTEREEVDDGDGEEDQSEDEEQLQFERHVPPRAPGGSSHAELTLYLSAPNGSCWRHVVGFDTTAAELCTRLREAGKGQNRLVHKGQELAPDVVLASSGVKHGDTLLVLSTSTTASTNAQGNDGFMDRRIAELEASIRSEMAVQLQTQLSSLRGSVDSHQSVSGGCYAGPLEDDDDGDDEPSTPSDALGEMRAAERRLCAQMEALEKKMASLVDKLRPISPVADHSVATLECAETKPLPIENLPTVVPPSPSASLHAPSPVSPVASLLSSEPRTPKDDSLLPWTLRCLFMEGDDEEDADELQVDARAEDTVLDLLEAIATEVEHDADRLSFARKSTGIVLADLVDLKKASADDDCVCCANVGRRLVTDQQAADLVVLRNSLGGAADALTPAADMRARSAVIDDGVAARQAHWRNRKDGSLGQADCARLQVRIQALHKLVDTVDKFKGFDQDMVDRIKRDLSTVCDGNSESVAAAIGRLEQAVDERASLLAAKAK